MPEETSPDHRRSISASVHPHPPSIYTGNKTSPTTAAPYSPRFEAATNPSNPFHRSLTGGHRSASSTAGLDTRQIHEQGDRIYPIRSLVSVDPNPTPFLPQSDKSDDYFTLQSRPSAARLPSSSTDPSSVSEDPLDQPPHKPDNPESSGRISPTQSRTNSGSVASTLTTTHDTATGTARDPPSSIFDDDASSSKDIDGMSAGASQAPSIAPSSGASSKNPRRVEEAGPIYTARFKHVVTEGGHAIITGRDGDTLQRCEDEPIHVPGAVQAFGLLIALEDGSADGKLPVRIVSENSSAILGYTPKQLFALDSFTDILSEEQADNLLDHVDFIRDDDADVEANGPEVLTMSIRDKSRRARKLWCAIHVNKSHPNLIICEFELEDDPTNPLVPHNDTTPEPPEDTLSSEPTEDELKESTETSSRPLRVLRGARKRKGEAAAMEVFNIMSQVQEQLANAPTLDAFLKVLVGIVKELTGFHRVMIYQFDQSWNGRVVTELLDPRATKDLYKGLNFPASDIPKQARDMYKINKVRLLYDRDQETARLVCKTMEDLETPLDLTHSYLRAMSPIHIKYLANMAVRSSMSISINAFNELWGLISCHAYGSKGTRVAFPIRKMCRLVGDSASRNIERLSYASRLQARKLINTAPTQKNPSGYIIASSDDLLKLFDADFGLLSIHNETKVLGKLIANQEALALLEYLRMRSFNAVMMSQDLTMDYPDLRYPPGFRTLAGFLLVPLSVDGDDFIVFFRKGQLREVKWAGNPYEKFVKAGTEGYLEPRKSFKTWSETVVGKCREWTEEEIETGAVLCLVYGKFIEVWRQKELALQNSQLTRLLLANSAHEVRTPLNAIINYLEIALEGTLDQETRENLAKSHSASKSLIYVINDLLDLTKTEAGNDLVRQDVFELIPTFMEAIDMFRGDAKRKSLKYEIIQHPPLPLNVLGDHRRVRQAISNIIENAIKNTAKGTVRVQIAVVERSAQQVHIEVVVEDTGAGMSTQKLDSLFTELEQVEAEQGGLVENTITSETQATSENPEKARTLGLGLAIVARIMRNMGGQLRVKSEENEGSRFVVQFPFALPQSSSEKAIDGTPARHPGDLLDTTALAITPSDSLKEKSEVTLVSHIARKVGAGDAEGLRNLGGRLDSRKSINSLQSLHSYHSISLSSQKSGKSDADRLIDAIQEPHMMEKSASHESVLPRSRATRRESLASGSSSLTTRSIDDKQPLISAQSPIRLKTSHSVETPGEKIIGGSMMPLRAVRVPDSEDLSTQALQESPQKNVPMTRILHEPPTTVREPAATKVTAEKMKVLVAEDDPVNTKIVQKRLDRAGHETTLTVNGEECASTYGEKPGLFDAVLMDMQVRLQYLLRDGQVLTTDSDANCGWFDSNQNDSIV